MAASKALFEVQVIPSNVHGPRPLTRTGGIWWRMPPGSGEVMTAALPAAAPRRATRLTKHFELFLMIIILQSRSPLRMPAVPGYCPKIGNRLQSANPDVSRRLPRTLLNDGDGVIDVDGADALLCTARRRALVVPAVHVVNHLFQIFDSCSLFPIAALVTPLPVRGMEILDHVQPSIAEQRKERLEAGTLMAPDMRPVVEYDIQPSHFRNHRTQERRIVLRSDSDLIRSAHPAGARWIYVYPEDCCLWPKVIAPQLERATLQHAYFQ